MSRIRVNFAEGTLEAFLSDTATVASSILFAELPAISGDDIMALTIDPEGAREIVWITAHAPGSDDVVLERGKEGTTAVEHVAGTPWTHGPTAADFEEPERIIEREMPVSDVWVIEHDFPHPPNVILINSAGDEFTADVHHVSGVVTITMAGAQAGTVYLRG